MTALFDPAAPKRPTNVSLNSDLLAKARAAGLNLSATLEQALIDGQLGTGDLPHHWNRLYHEYLGIAVPNDKQGVLQDVHWSCGLFGYFPTYTLGNLYAAQFAAAADKALGGLPALLERGQFATLREWLRRQIHRHGRRHTPAELCQLVTGAPLSSAPFLAYLEQKLAVVYGL